MNATPVVDAAVRLVWLAAPFFLAALVCCAGIVGQVRHHRAGDSGPSDWAFATAIGAVLALVFWAAMYFPVVTLAGALDAWLHG